MGNKLGKKRQVVDEKYTKPQGLYPIKDVDFKKLRKLILESKLAPCYPGGDDGDSGLLEECPICFLHYPTLNRSRCCTKSICTECFLQMKNPNSTRPTQCPFCKASNYAVEYRGGKSKEERGLEQIEEQKVIEAKIRKQQQDFQEEEERMHRRQETSSSSGVTHTENIEGTTSRVVEGEAIVSSQDLIATPVPRQQQHQWPNREDDFDWDLEDIMVMEAIWLSVQDNVVQPAEQPPYRSSSQLPPPSLPPPPPPPPLLSSGGLVSTIAALAERQQMGGDPFTRNNYYNNRCISSHPPQPLSPTSLSMPARLGSADVSSLADCQHLGGEPSSSSNYYNNSSRNQNITLADNMLASSSSSKASSQPKKSNWSHFFNPLSNSVEYQHNRMAVSSNDCGEWVTNGDGTINTNRLGVGEAGTSFPRRSSDESEPEGEFMLPPPPPPLLPRGSFECSCSDESDGEDEFKYLQLPPPPPPPPFLPATSSQQQQFAGGGTGEGFHGGMAGPIVPESFEEQMMFAMAVSLAEARARTSAAQGVAWQ